LVLTDTPPNLGSLKPPLARNDVTRIFFLAQQLERVFLAPDLDLAGL